MGVMSCKRRYCTNVMCDTHIETIGYVCFDCQKEFEKWLEKNEANPKTQQEIVAYLDKFMNTDKNEFDDENQISISEFFRINSR
jgi:actin-related protein